MYMGEVPATPRPDPAYEALRRKLQPFTNTQRLRRLFRTGRNPDYPPDDSNVAYPDVLELRSISPAAKRFICAERWLREKDAEHEYESAIYKFLGLPRSVARWWKGEIE